MSQSPPGSRSSPGSQAPPGSKPIRVVLVEDHDMVAEAIGLALDRPVDIQVVGTAKSIATGVEATRVGQPDVVVLDRRLPDGDGVDAIPELVAAAPNVRVLVLTGEASVSVATRIAEAGGAGLVLKSSPLDELEAAVRQVADGEVVFSRGLLAGVLKQLTDGAQGGTRLTARETQTLLLLAEGSSTEEISARMGVARNTARNHVQRVLEKVGARSKLEAVAIARRRGLLD